MIHLGLLIIDLFHAKCCMKREELFHVMTFVENRLKNIIAACITQSYEVFLVGPSHGEKYPDDLNKIQEPSPRQFKTPNFQFQFYK